MSDSIKIKRLEVDDVYDVADWSAAEFAQYAPDELLKLRQRMKREHMTTSRIEPAINRAVARENKRFIEVEMPAMIEVLRDLDRGMPWGGR